MNHTNITIAGGGIGGLTLAIALSRQGHRIRVYEQAPHFAPVGAGITLGANAMRVYRDLGIADELIERGNRLRTVGVKSSDGKVLSLIDGKRLEADLGIGSIAIHRADLHEVLLNQIEPETIVNGERLASYSQDEDSVSITFDSGLSVSSELLIGTDGINSNVAKTMLGDLPKRDAKEICFRGVCDSSSINWDIGEMVEIWGSTGRFGVVPINAQKIYWFLTVDRDSFPTPEKNIRDQLNDLFAGWCEPVESLLRNTRPDDILQNDLWDRPPMNQWHDGRVALLGDAAHPTTPNMGQGAAMAIESAAVLAKSLDENPNHNSAFESYEKRRMKRTRNVTEQSWRIGQIASLRNPVAIALRNWLVSASRGMAYQQVRKMMGFDIYRGE